MARSLEIKTNDQGWRQTLSRVGTGRPMVLVAGALRPADGIGATLGLPELGLLGLSDAGFDVDSRPDRADSRDRREPSDSQQSGLVVGGHDAAGLADGRRLPCSKMGAESASGCRRTRSSCGPVGRGAAELHGLSRRCRNIGCWDGGGCSSTSTLASLSWRAQGLHDALRHTTRSRLSAPASPDGLRIPHRRKRECRHPAASGTDQGNRPTFGRGPTGPVTRVNLDADVGTIPKPR